MKKLVVNEEACIGCGACVSIDPLHFDFNDEGLSEAISQDNIDTDEVKNAIESCPTNAIKYQNDCECNSEDDCKCEGTCDCENCDCE